MNSEYFTIFHKLEFSLYDITYDYNRIFNNTSCDQDTLHNSKVRTGNFEKGLILRS